MDCAGVGAGTALPAAVYVLSAWQGFDFFLHFFVVIIDHPALDKSAPVTGNVDAFNLKFFLNLKVFGAYQ
jgi:hypothetical protein